MYGHLKHTLPEIYHPLREYLVGNQVIALKISGKAAIQRLLELRGASNPKDAAPGTIRGDYAKDQDYELLLAQGKPSLNLFHAASDRKEADSTLQSFFGTDSEIVSLYSSNFTKGLYTSQAPHRQTR
jgi:nucleoside-diphosphate kinase